MWERLQKFGPSQCDMSTMVSNINVLLRVLMLNVDNRVNTPIPKLSQLVGMSNIVLYYYAYHISLVWFAVWRPRQESFLNAMIIFGALAVASNIAVIKLCHMLAYRTKVSYLVTECLEVDALSKPGSRFFGNMMLGLRTVKLRAISFWITVNVIAVLYLSIPPFLPGRHLPEDLLVFLGLDPAHQSPNYEISYLIIALTVCFICYTVSTTSAFIIILIGYVSVQMTCLSQEILSIWDDAVQEAVTFKLELIYPFPRKHFIYDAHTKNKINVEVRKSLVDIMQRHARIITLVKNIDDVFNIPNALAFVSSALALITELLGGLENTYLQVPFTFFQVAMDCYIGQSVVDGSVAIEEAVFACKWENFNKENMKIVLVMLQSCQKTLKMTTGSMAVMNLACLMSVVRSVYSSYTTLRSTMRRNL